MPRDYIKPSLANGLEGFLARGAEELEAVLV